MNTITKTALCVWAFLMFAALEPARAFYDPGTQRWLNRDPLEEVSVAAKRGYPDAGVLWIGNSYAFCENAPVSFLDPNGDTSTTYPTSVGLPKPSIGILGRAVPVATIAVCVRNMWKIAEEIKKCLDQCNAVWFAEEHVCGQLPVRYRARCYATADRNLDRCLRACKE